MSTGLGLLWWHRFRSAGPVPDPVCVPPPVVLLLQDTGKYHMLGSGWQTHRVCAELIPTSGWSQNECEPIYSDQYVCVFVYNISDTKIYWVHWEKKINMLIYIILLQQRIAFKKNTVQASVLMYTQRPNTWNYSNKKEKRRCELVTWVFLFYDCISFRKKRQQNIIFFGVQIILTWLQNLIQMVWFLM